LVKAELVEAILEMTPDLAASLIDTLEAWANDGGGLFGTDLGSLVAKLASGGQKDAALRLAGKLLEFVPREGEGTSLSLIPRTRTNWWENERILDNALPELVKAAGVEALRLLCGQLATAIKLSLREPEKSAPNDLSHLWRPAVEENEQNSFPEVRSLLVRAVRDSAMSILQSGQATLSKTVQTLQEQRPRWRIFDRIVMHLLTRIEDVAISQLTADYLTNRDFSIRRNACTNT
jgi:hypothetical protein